ncbi:hypothetical protein [Chondromyces crocatus]|uniref:Uncharacterized protein n=1 Tax=Chondromyces crocatus TaxID=52 RepID=A0A0K1ELZ9_CHOCO|nr:hypothetical protein [Chondromyces crocatus]AKT41925.1 uncharacterized protein CMC5_061470 [Chondromyces crocatus]
MQHRHVAALRCVMVRPLPHVLVQTLALVTTLALAPLHLSTAHAQEPTRVERTWYGWQNLIGFGTAYGLLGAGASVESGSTALLIAGAATYTLSSPIIHLAHGNMASAAKSVGLNVGLPLCGAALGASLICGTGGCKSSRFGTVISVLTGAILATASVVTATVIDVSLLAHEETPRGAPPTPSGLVPEAARYQPIFQAGWTF